MPLASFMNAPRRVFSGFAIYAFSMGSIFPRYGDVQLAMGVEEGALGLAMIGAPVGTLAALTLAGPFLERVGYRATVLIGIPLCALLYSIAVWAPSPLILFLLLLPVGATIGCIEIALNLEADRAEHAAGYRIMNRAHAFWSFGFFAAGLFGAAMAGLGLTPQMHLALVVPISLLGVWLMLSDFHPSPDRHRGEVEKAPKFAAPSGPILVLVAVTLSAMLLEGGSMDWSAIYMRDEFAAGPFVAGLAVACAAFFQFAARFFADGFVDRHSPAGVARAMLSVLMAGCLLVVFSPFAWASLLGFALIGIGSSVLFPLAMSAAAQRKDRSAAINVAALAQFSFLTFMLAPPLLGVIAEHWGIRASFAVGLPLVLLSLATSGSLGGKR